MSNNHPDANIHPEATGPAKATAKAHFAPCDLQFYSGWFCPFAQRVWIALEEKGIQYQYIEVNPYHKPKSLLDLNPRGLVPTLKWKDKPVYESSVLIQFLEEAYPHHSPKLMPEDPYLRWKVRVWTDFITTRIVPGFVRFLGAQDEKLLEEQREEFLGHLKEIAKAMDPEGPFFLGRDFGAVDVMLAPWAMRFWAFDHFKKGGLGVPDKGKGGEDEEVWERWRKWVEAVKERRSVKETMSEREHYLPVYQRYADDKAQSQLAKALRAGKAVP
ncbi:glutathione S-transferase [Westerdykella ornata]|uniref:Glutathione S-transferase n=1 Tax=Westerdykella ornata TaxID=318751 RepID=A0A6A6J8D6_WESOR|nr:glutathione S-transferase [Westerdykella ornata]KAF2272423.1 glutathione S-transferase [Westerdykella ornata]